MGFHSPLRFPWLLLVFFLVIGSDDLVIGSDDLVIGSDDLVIWNGEIL